MERDRHMMDMRERERRRDRDREGGTDGEKKDTAIRETDRRRGSKRMRERQTETEE